MLFQLTLLREPDALALLDPLNKVQVTGHLPKQLTYAEADRAIAALSTYFIELGLPANSVIAIQLPNTVEFVITVLAAHRAGLVVAVLPLLWRHADLTAALNRTAARALVTMSKIDGVSYADLAAHAAADAFSIRHTCSFGSELPEGMASLDEVLTREPRLIRSVIQDGRKVAVISFDVTAEGLRPIPRPHFSLIAAGLAISLEGKVRQGAAVMSAFAPTSFAGLASSLVIWLLSAGTLALHHPFNNEVLELQINAHGCDVLVAPAQLALSLGKFDLSEQMPSLRNVIGLWRAPEQVATSDAWTIPHAPFTDVCLFGEAGLLAVRRDENGLPTPLMPALQDAPSGPSGPSIACEIILSPQGTLGLRGPMVPFAAYAPPRPFRESLAAPSRHEYVDTGYPAQINQTSGAICITAPPSGIVAIGGYRFLSNDLEEWARRLGQGTLLTALPDRLTGHRLAGQTKDTARARKVLGELGLNPLMAESFNDRTA